MGLLDAVVLPQLRQAMHGTRETRAFLVQLTLLSLQLLFSNRQERCVETSYLVLKIGK